MRDIAVVLCCFVAACGTSGSDEDETNLAQKRCIELRDHVVDLRVTNAVGAQAPELEAHRAAMRQALGATYIEGCVNTMSSAQVTCALEATDSAGVAACTDRTQSANATAQK